MHIKIKKGLDLPIKGRASGQVHDLPLSTTAALDLAPFENTRFLLRKKVGEQVKVGEVLVEDKSVLGRIFVSPVSGQVKEIIRGLKRRILQIVIDAHPKQTDLCRPPLDLKKVTNEQLLEALMEGGIFPLIRVRPCLRLPHPLEHPRVVFIQGLDSSPLSPSPELELEGYEEEFQAGLEALSLLCPVHLVCDYLTQCPALLNAKHVLRHTAEGPHPVGNPSVHIEKLSPIEHRDDVIWTLGIHGVIAVGMRIRHGRYYNQRVVSIAGEGIASERRGFFRVNHGYPVRELLHQRLAAGNHRLISGDPLSGTQVEEGGFLGFFDRVVCAIPEMAQKREWLHFMKLGRKGFSLSRTYFSLPKKRDMPSFTTHQHGERRSFVVSTPYEKVMPMRIPVMHLIKALIAEDYERAEQLGLLEIAPEDLALPAFVCPSKIEMVQIVHNALHEYTKQFFPDKPLKLTLSS